MCIRDRRYLDLQRLYPYVFAEAGSDEARHLVRRPYLAKGVEYSSENEVRLVTVGPVCHGKVLNSVSPDLWMEEIVTSPHLPESEFDAFKSTVKQLCPSLESKVRRSRLFEGPPHVQEQKAQDKDFYNRFEQFFEDSKSQQLPEFFRKP